VQPFRYFRPESREEAGQQLLEPGAVPLAGGTDLVPLLRDAVAHAELVVDVRGIAGATTIEEEADGGFLLGAAVTLSTLSSNARIAERFPSLALACRAAGSHQLRNMATIGGNLCQRPRCSYFRNGLTCLKRGDDHCGAAVGEHRHSALFRTGPCIAVHPSDPAVALVALNASIVTEKGGTTRTISAEQFWVPSSQDVSRETVLEAGELIAHIHVPGACSGRLQFFEKVTQRAAWDFALVSVAAARDATGNVRIALGGVSYAPLRINSSVEEDIASGGLGADDIETLAERALYDADPLPDTEYKRKIAATLLRRAIHHIS
jgi:xanthine dehydrogenase YagS FAD-binding subunit